MEVTFYPAPGKLNLFLHIVGRREGGEHAGYHELQTVFRLVERADRVGIAARMDGEVGFSGIFDKENLCLKAALLLKQRSGTKHGCDLRLEKNLPVGGGMGGGSSDAATVLIVLNRLWDLHLPPGDLLQMGLQLGADVPFFLLGRNALGEGIGERLTPLDLPHAWYLVLAPQVAVSTASVFSDKSLTRNTKPLKIPPFFAGQGANDLEVIVARRYPAVAAQLAWLKDRCPQARMTGSGACVFAEFRTEAEARALERTLPLHVHGFVTQGLDKHPLYDWTQSRTQSRT
jgi:4-diphosphocytidyl-2-C-methyl-D-erythritol kinase